MIERFWMLMALAMLCVPAFAQEEVALAAAPTWVLRPPAADKIIFQGSVNHDHAGMGAAPMQYAAPDLASFIAQIVTQGILTESLKKSEKERLQTEADAVLQPYTPALVRISSKGLHRGALQHRQKPGALRLLAANEAVGEAWVIETSPSYLRHPISALSSWTI